MKITKLFLLGCTTSVIAMLAKTTEATIMFALLSTLWFVLDAILDKSHE